MHRIKKIGRAAVTRALASFARTALTKFRPEVIAITGSMGKTTAKDATAYLLASKFPVRSPKRSYNSEIGLPLAVFDLDVPWPTYSPIGWIDVLIKAAYRRNREGRFGEKLVLEMGADKPGDIEYLLTIAKPNVSIVTAIAPVHTEEFKTIEDIALEKGKIVAALPQDGLAVLNGDDPNVLKMRDKTKAEVVTFGFKKTNDVVASDAKLTSEGMKFTLKFRHGAALIRSQVVGEHSIMPLLASAAVAVHYGIKIKEIATLLHNFEPPNGRMRPIRGTKGSWIIDDSYNSSPEACAAALKTLRQLPAKRKIAALGSMNELGEYAESSHRAIGALAAEFVDLLLTVGDDAKKFLADEAVKKGMPQDRVVSFMNSKEAGDFLRGILKKGDVVLVKGSQNKIRMERTVERIMADAHLAPKLLVRQGREWRG